jgi:PAP2 superfamily
MPDKSPTPVPTLLSRRRRSRLVVAGTCVALAATFGSVPVTATAGGSGHGRSATDTYVAQWDEIGSQAFTASALSPAEGHVLFAYSSIAVYDAVMAVHRDHRPFAVRDRAPRGTSAEAAVVAAAHRIYSHYLPAQVPTILDPAYDASLATIADGPAEDSGVALGRRVANALIALRQDDGFRASVTYTPPTPPMAGDWVPTATTTPFGTYLPGMRPFALESADQFRPDGPPDLESRRWARDFNEVKKLGSSTSTSRTPDQTLAAQFWAEPPVQQAHAALRGVIGERDLDIAEAARMMAMASVGYADSIIACFDAKYHYEFWRPITAIPAGNSDGNRATVGDPDWKPLLPGTPNHPEYPSAHACITPAGGAMLAAFLRTRHIDLTMPSLTGLGDRHFDTLWELTHEVGNARVWGGIHFRSAVDDGVEIALRTAREILKHNFERSWHGQSR